MSTEAAELLRLEGAGLARDGQWLLQDIDLSLVAGQIVSLIGPNGAGKTTLVKLVLGLLTAERGRVWRRPGLRIGYMPQRLQLNPAMPMTVNRFLALSRAPRTAIAAALAETGIAALGNSPMQDISGGETQRVLLARALLRRPQLLVLDEPAQGVDIAGQTELYELISALRDRLGCGVLMVSHDLHWVMAQTDSVVCLNQHICCHGHPAHISSDPAYLSLFGERHAHALAPYRHRHDHRHDMHGDVVNAKPQPQNAATDREQGRG